MAVVENTAVQAAVLPKRAHTLADFIKRYGPYHGCSANKEHCARWALYHFNIYLEDGVLPDFMR